MGPRFPLDLVPAVATFAAAAVVSFEVPGLPIPWSAPTVMRGKGGGRPHGVKAPHLLEWQGMVAAAAAEAWQGATPLQDPSLLVCYLCRRAAGRKPRLGEWWDVRPDRVNLVKAIEDAISGRVRDSDPRGQVLADDNRLAAALELKFYWHRPLAWVLVAPLAAYFTGPFPFAADGVTPLQSLRVGQSAHKFRRKTAARKAS